MHLFPLASIFTVIMTDVWRIVGVGLNGMISPVVPLDLGNSGTGVRLLMGVVAGQKITATFTGDASLSAGQWHASQTLLPKWVPKSSAVMAACFL